ncbi:MAG: DUF3592 domain-containing protein [Clostridia bacterium]|nr:DUF3592 domain-containing protein [Clostridia bacterium]
MENKFARFMRNTGPARFLVPLGIILIVAGIIMLGINTDNYLETTGTIGSVTECARIEDEPQQYDLVIVYTVDGKDYTTTFSGLSGSYKVGDAIQVFYDPANPAKTTNNKMGGFLPIIMIVVGAAALVFGVYTAVRAFRKSKALDEAVPGGVDSISFDGFKTSPGVREYYCRFDGQMLKPGYILEDENRMVLFEGKMTKQALVGARTFEFRNQTTGEVKEHQVGHTVTSTIDDSVFSASSSFKLDGVNVWDHLHSLGIRIRTSLTSKFPNLVYNVSKDGKAFAILETSGQYVHEDEASQHSVNIPVGRYYYRIWTDSSDFETLFTTVFAISETEQAVVE